MSLVTPALLQELNALLVREGHAVAGKPPGTALDGRVDSFVVETDVHYPTDVNLLWDAMRVVLTEVSICCGSHGVSGWWQGQVLAEPGSAGLSTGEPRAVVVPTPEGAGGVVDPVRRSDGASGRDTLEGAGRIAGGLGVAPAQLSRWCWFHACSVRLQDQIRRRVLEGETIPHEEKLFSLFEPHTRWIMKGKAGPAGGAGGSPSNSPYSPNPAIGMGFAHWLSQ